MTSSAHAQTAMILVVDDNEDNRLLALSTLEDEGYRVVLAGGGLAGVAAFQRERPDCILLDVRMPHMDGFAVCQRIRALPGGNETPIVFLTALRDVETFDGALRAGGDDFLTKPIRPTELVIRVQAALKLRRMGVELRAHYELLKDQRNDLVRLQLQKERLMAFVVHDLKNPLNSMALRTQLLLREEGLSDGVRKSLTSMYEATRALNGMIMNLLDFSKAEEGKLTANRLEVDLPALVAEIFEELEVNAKRRNLQLQSSMLVAEIRADRELFRRILTNLIENAIRYAPSETIVSVTASHVATGTEVRVADAGGGIPQAMREKVFDAFVQVESSEHALKRGGHGLGLAFCKLAMEAHGGSIWVEDGAPGAVFCLRLPNDV